MPVKPPRPKGPPLNAMRAFEAAARLGGFALAADELCVTPGAISQHIKVLEDWAGTPLFERRSQGVRLTEAGERLAPDFVAAFDHIGHATRALRNVAPEPVIRIAALPSLAQLWLSPRLPNLREAFPDIRFSVTALESPPNLKREMFDWSLFFDTPTGAKNEIVLEQDIIFPVCSPEIAAQLGSPQQLDDFPLIVDEAWTNDWALWAKSAGWHPSAPPAGARFSLYALALEEALNGAGVMIGHAALVRRVMEQGDLVAPFETRVSTGRSLILKTATESQLASEAFVMIG